MDGAGGGHSNAAGAPSQASSQPLPSSSSTPAPRALTVSKSDLEARGVHGGDGFPGSHLHRLESLGGSWAGNQAGWRAGELAEEGAVGGGESFETPLLSRFFLRDRKSTRLNSSH